VVGGLNPRTKIKNKHKLITPPPPIAVLNSLL
jgi:hypothetical protein